MSDTALRLADEIERDYYDKTLAPRKAAAEMRRLVAENEALRADAERYWWLLKNYLSFRLCDEALAHGSLDAAIDAAKREWAGLTADEIWKCNKAKSGSAVEFHICYEHQNVEDFAKSIEAKLKEKNHG